MSMDNVDDVRWEVKSLLKVLIDLAEYTREELIEIVDEAVEHE